MSSVTNKVAASLEAFMEATGKLNKRLLELPVRRDFRTESEWEAALEEWRVDIYDLADKQSKTWQKLRLDADFA